MFSHHQIAQSFLLKEPPFLNIDDCRVNPYLKKKQRYTQKPYYSDVLSNDLNQTQKHHRKQAYKKEFNTKPY